MGEYTTGDEATGWGAKVLSLIDKAIAAQQPLADSHVSWLRGRGRSGSRPDGGHSPVQVLQKLNAEFRAATVTSGAGVGATAAAPGVGTGVAAALSTAEAAAFLEASVLYVLSRARIYGIEIQDVERMRALVLAVLLGEAGSKVVGRVAERTGQHWARLLVKGIPTDTIRALNRILGRNFVTKYGTKQGIIVLGRATPFGIGAVIGGGANAILSQTAIVAANRAFGPAPSEWPV